MRSVTYSQGERNILHTVKQRKANWISHLVRWNCLLKDVTEETIEGTGRRRKRRKQLLDDLQEKGRRWELKNKEHYLPFARELALEGAIGQWQSRLLNNPGVLLRSCESW